MKSVAYEKIIKYNTWGRELKLYLQSPGLIHTLFGRRPTRDEKSSSVLRGTAAGSRNGVIAGSAGAVEAGAVAQRR